MSEVLGRAYDHADLELQVAIGDDIRTFGFEEASYSAPRTQAAVYRNQRVPQERTKGRIDPEGSVKLTKSVADDFIRFVGEKAGGIYDAKATFTFIYGSDEQGKVTDILEQVEITDVQGTSTGGEEAISVTFPFKFRNGTISGVPFFKGST